MDPTVAVAIVTALVALMTSVVSPILLSYLTGMQRRQERRDDYARQDMVAARAEKAVVDAAHQQTETARLLAQRQNEAARKADEVAAQAAQAATLLLEQQQLTNAKADEVAGKAAIAVEIASSSADAVADQLKQIHTLVNSNLTEAKLSELHATERDLASLREITEMRQAAGHPPTVTTLASIESATQRIAELEAELSDRHNQQERALGKQVT